MKKLSVLDMNRLTVEEFKETPKIPVVVVLDHVRSLYNVGSVFRTSDAFKIEQIILCGITATPPNVEIHKTALGAEDTVMWQYFKETAEAVSSLRDESYSVYAVEQVFDSIPLQNFTIDRSKKYAIVLGNEVKGVQQSVVDICDGSIEIPQFGTKHSLNVSTTAGIVIWQLAKQFLL